MISWCQNVSILDFIGAKDDGGGGDNWSYKTCNAPVKCHHQQTNRQLFTGLMPFLPVISQSTEGKMFCESEPFEMSDLY